MTRTRIFRLRRLLGAGVAAVMLAAMGVTGVAMSAAAVDGAAGKISGVVLDKTTLQPIIGAQVSINMMSPSYFFFTTTDVNGYYEADNVPNGTANVSASKSMGASYLSSSSQVVLTEGSNIRTRDFKLRPSPSGAAVISGTVTEAGQPVVGLQLSAILPSTGTSFYATTDDAGFYEITGLPAATLQLSFFGGGYEFQPLTYTQYKVVVPTSSATVTRDLALTRWAIGDASISGTVLDSRTDLPVSAAFIHLSSSNPLNAPRQTSVNSAGEWQLSGLPAGTYQLWISPSSSDYLWKYDGVDVVVGEHAVLTRVDYLTSLAPGTAKVSGRVSDISTHLPIDGVEIVLTRNEAGITIAPAVSDASGAYSFAGLPDGLYSLSTYKDGYVQGWGSISIAGGNETRNLRLAPSAVIPVGDGTITGTVLDVLGEPIADAEVNVWTPILNGGFASTSTDEHGNFELTGLPLIESQVTVSQPVGGEDSYASVELTVQLSTAEPTASVEVTLYAAASVSGQVSSDSGTLGGSLVAQVINASTGVVQWTARVDQVTGEYSIGELPAGDYVVLIAQQSGFGQTPDLPDASGSLGQAYWVNGDSDGSASRGDATVITLEPGDAVSDVDVLLHKGGAIGGHVTVSTGSSSIPLPSGRSVRVNVYHQEGAVWKPVDFATAEASQYSSSQFIATGLAAGSYKLEFIDLWEGNRAFVTTYNGGASSLASAPVIHVTAGSTTYSGTTPLEVVAPGVDPFTVDLSSLPAEEQAALENGISTDSGPTAGEHTEIQVGEEFAGEWVAVWANSTPTRVSSWVQVAADGSITVTLPTTLVGNHKVIVQDADQKPLGWAPVEIGAATTAPPTGNGGTTTPPSSSKPGASGSGTPTITATPTPSAEPTEAPTADESADDAVDSAAGAPASTAEEGGFNAMPIIVIVALVLLVGIAGVVVFRRRVA